MSNKNNQKNTQVVNVKIINPDRPKRIYRTKPKPSLAEQEMALQALEQNDQVISNSTPSGLGGASIPNQVGFANIPTQQQENPFNETQVYSLANKAIDDRLAKFQATQNYSNVDKPTDNLPITNASFKTRGRPVGTKNKPKPITNIPTTDEVLAITSANQVTAPKPIKTSEFKQKRQYNKNPDKIRKKKGPVELIIKGDDEPFGVDSSGLAQEL